LRTAITKNELHRLLKNVTIGFSSVEKYVVLNFGVPLPGLYSHNAADTS